MWTRSRCTDTRLGTLLTSYRRHLATKSAVSCKRVDVLKLQLADFKTLQSPLEAGFKRAAELLAEEKIFDARSLPYATQLIPLAAICAQLGDKTTQHGVKQLLLRWFWSGVLGELYGGANETRFAMDMQDVVAWVAGGPEPRSVRDANFAPTRLLSLQSRLAAAYKGLAALLMKHGGRDFASGTPIDLNTYFNNAIDIHHIFPRVWCEKQKLPKEKWNSVINKAPLAASTNRFISGDGTPRAGRTGLSHPLPRDARASVDDQHDRVSASLRILASATTVRPAAEPQSATYRRT